MPELLLSSHSGCTYESDVTFDNLTVDVGTDGTIPVTFGYDEWGPDQYIGTARGDVALSLTVGAPGSLNATASASWNDPRGKTKTFTTAVGREVVQLP